MTPKKAKATLLELVKLRAKVKTADKRGYVYCCTCSLHRHWTLMQGGHFRPMSNGLSTAYELDNLNAQCAGCNGRANQGEQYLHGLYIDRTYYAGRAEELTKQAKQAKQRKIGELMDCIDNVIILLVDWHNKQDKQQQNEFVKYICKPHRKAIIHDLLQKITKI